MKANTIRKKAQEYVQKRDWPKAINEYKRLIELDKHNPNIFNELGDLYLKVGNKHDAFMSFESAVDAYTRVRLYNNAVAVCKKILRLSPNQLNILFKLGSLKKSQGIKKESVSYFLSYMEKIILDVNLEPSQLKEKVLEVAQEMPESPDILERIADYMLKWEFRDEGTDFLLKLRSLYKQNGQEDRSKEVEVKLNVLGYDAEAAKAQGVGDGEKPEMEISIGSGMEPQKAKRGVGEGDVSEGLQARAGENDNDVKSFDRSAGYEYRNVQLGEEEAQSTSSGKPQGVRGGAGDNKGATSTENLPKDSTIENPAVQSTKIPGDERDVHVSKIVDEFKSEIKDAIDEEDYRSHYDLGMAYLEMELLPEAIHEFQLAAKSNSFKLKSLEMVGMCFMRQDQPHLAIKQLEKGLAQVQGDNRDALGLLYTLGLAYEMVGDKDKAKGYFEDVYVVDVAFRDVAEKIKQYST